MLLPWLPASGRMYDVLMPHLARAGFRAIAFDLAGTGRSHKKCRNWTVQQYAADVLEACGSLHTVPYTVIGGRFARVGGRGDVVSLARAGHRRGARRRAGLAPEELRKMSTPTTGLSPKLADDGGYRSFAFDVMRAHAQGVGSVLRAHRRKRCRWSTNIMRDYLELGYEAIVAGAEADAKRSQARLRRAGASRRSVAARAGDDFGYRHPRAGLQPRAGTRAQFARPQVRGQSPGAHARRAPPNTRRCWCRSRAAEARQLARQRQVVDLLRQGVGQRQRAARA